MKLSEIELEALRLMFAGSGEEFFTGGLSVCRENENYRALLAAMPGAVGRALSELSRRGLLPLRAAVLQPTEGTRRGFWLSFPLTRLVPDLSRVSRVSYENAAGEYRGACDYRVEGESLLLPQTEAGGFYTVLYHPVPVLPDEATDPESELPVPPVLAAALPYFLMSELYREDDPEAALAARGRWESALTAAEKAAGCAESARTGSVFECYSLREVCR